MNVREAKTQLSRLVEAAAAGQEIVIVKAGKPMAKLSALGHEHGPRRLGILKGKLRVPKNFDAPLPRALLDTYIRIRVLGEPNKLPIS
ncbi:MAG: type II toxin-antitoxin system prevent-host-death family antitoxin [Candidatus Cybelea sp.]